MDIWPTECSKHTYSGLDKFVCLACSPDQLKYTQFHADGKPHYVRVCESLLRDYYGGDLAEPTFKFKECGAWNDPDAHLIPENPDDEANNTTWILNDAESKRLIFP